MRRLRFMKKVAPELVSYLCIRGETLPEYRCVCGFAANVDHTYCPYCGSEFNWSKMDKKSKDFQKFIKGL